MEKNIEKYDLSIIGGGPAGLTAAIYSYRAGLKTIVFSALDPGSQILKTNSLENFPGFPETISGYELIDKMQNQARNLGVNLIDEKILSFAKEGDLFFLKTESGMEIQSSSTIIAAGSVPKMLGLPSENIFFGRGVSTCAVCDGAFFRNKEVAVVGGGDSAVGDAIYLSRFVSKVYLIHRRQQFRANEAILNRARKNSKIQFVLDSIITDIMGDRSVSSISVKNLINGEIKNIPVQGVFIAIGQKPASDLFAGIVELNPDGTIRVDDRCRTNVPGLFAAGDVADSLYRQAIIAAASGAKAAFEAGMFLKS